jgi:potassium efflux system protein
MKRLIFFCSLIFIGFNLLAQSKHIKTAVPDNQQPINTLLSDKTSKADAGTNKQSHNKKFLVKDTLTLGDYMMSIERVNDNLNSISDSANLSFEVVGVGRRIDEISDDISLIRQNVRGRKSVINIRNLYLYQSFASNLDKDNSRIQARLTLMYKRVYHAKLQLKTVLSDSVFRKLYSDSSFQKTFDRKLVRLERKWTKTDSVTKSSIDSLNSLKVKAADNSMSLATILNIIDSRLDRTEPKLFGPEVNYIWQKAVKEDPSQKPQSLLSSEQKAIGYYFSQTSKERILVLVLGILLLTWLFLKRKLLKILRGEKESYSFLHIQYLDSSPVLSLLVLLFCLMPFSDAYAPTSYIAVEYTLLLMVSSVIFFKLKDRTFCFDWLALVILFIAGILTYLLIIPTLVARLWLLALQIGTIVFIIRFRRNLVKQMPYYKWIRGSSVLAILLSFLSIIANLLGRFSLSGILGIASIFAVTQAVILPVFIDTVIEFVLLQLQSSRMKKGVDRPFDSSIVITKIKKPLLVVAVILWLIMLTSNLNIYYNISNSVVELLTTTRTIGSISYRLINVLLFFVIIWFAHILQQMVGFLVGETGIEMEDSLPGSKVKHSRLLITKLLLLIGGYLLAIAASGLPLDKLTIILGALGVGIGMGLQNMVNNFVSGIVLIFDGSLKIGDEIEVNGQAGKVKEIGLRAVTLNTADGADVIIPNGPILSQNIVNWTYSNDQKRVFIWFTISGKELDANVINEVINDTIKNIPNVISQKKPIILFNRVAQGTCTMTVRFWCSISNTDTVKSEAMLQLSTAFAAKNIGFE